MTPVDAPPVSTLGDGERFVHALMALANAGVPTDIQGLLKHGNPDLGVKPNALADAIAAWNRRPPASSPVAEVKERQETDAAAKAAYFAYMDSRGYPNGMATWDELPLAFPEKNGLHHPDGQETWREIARAAISTLTAPTSPGVAEAMREAAAEPVAWQVRNVKHRGEEFGWDTYTREPDWAETETNRDGSKRWDIRSLYAAPTGVETAEGWQPPADIPKPIAIWHEGDARAYYEASPEERDAWNIYAQTEANKFSQGLDAYETIHGHIGYDRDGKITDWCPPKFFPEWLAERPEL